MDCNLKNLISIMFFPGCVGRLKKLIIVSPFLIKLIDILLSRSNFMFEQRNFVKYMV